MAVSMTTSWRVSRLQVSQRIKELHVQFQRAQFYMYALISHAFQNIQLIIKFHENYLIRTNPVERPFFATNNGYVWEGTVAPV
jgi:hypothetical protein